MSVKGKRTQETTSSKKYQDKIYQLTDDRSGEAFLLKSGKNRKLLIFDEELGYNRAIRNCPNEKSIFIDEQSEHALVAPIIFERGILEVKKEDQITQKFLELHPDNVINGGAWFEEIDENKDAEAQIEFEDLVLDIKSEIRQTAKKKDGILQLEMVTAVILNDITKASEMSEEAMKRVLYNEVDKDPYYFLDDKGNVNIFDDSAMQRKYLVLRGLKDGVLVKSTNQKSILWGNTKEVIATSPRGVNIVDYFADYLASEEGMLIIEEMKKRS